MKNCKQVTSLLLYICIILSWRCNVTAPAQQLPGLFHGPVQLTKLPDSYAQSSDAFSFSPGFLRRAGLRRGLLDARAEQGRLTRKLESAAGLRGGNRIFFPFWHQQQPDLVNSCCVSSY